MAKSEEQIIDQLRQNLADVQGRIAAAAKRSGRTDRDLALVGVTKYVEPPVARLLAEAGLKELGESRPQELWRKAEALADLQVHWHLIGHLQRNKVKRTLPLVACIHSVDSLTLLEEIDRHGAGLPRPVVNALLEVNISGEAAKHGLLPGEVEPLLSKISELNHLSVLGLMTMASLEGGPEQARRDFAALRALRDSLKKNCPSRILLNELSMGMSGDFEVAIEEGATMVRVGSALFEGLE